MLALDFNLKFFSTHTQLSMSWMQQVSRFTWTGQAAPELY